MPDRPIIFSAPMIRALIDGRKTMTRRIIKPQPSRPEEIPANATWTPDNGFKPDKRSGQTWALHSPYLTNSRLLHAACRVRFIVGDRLWVREGGRLLSVADGHDPRTGRDRWTKMGCRYRADDAVIYFGEYAGRETEFDPENTSAPFPSIHMPRWASRLTLTVTAVQVERLQAISEADALAEGMPDYRMLQTACTEDVAEAQSRLRWPQREFANLWNSLHGPGAWDANPWVVALTFTVARRNIDA